MYKKIAPDCRVLWRFTIFQVMKDFNGTLEYRECSQEASFLKFYAEWERLKANGASKAVVYTAGRKHRIEVERLRIKALKIFRAKWIKDQSTGFARRQQDQTGLVENVEENYTKLPV